MSADVRLVAARLATARRAVLTIFFINGAVFASWAPYIPGVRERHRLSEGALGLSAAVYRARRVGGDGRQRMAAGGARFGGHGNRQLGVLPDPPSAGFGPSAAMADRGAAGFPALLMAPWMWR